MKKCPVCNNNLKNNAVFCDSCGSEVTASSGTHSVKRTKGNLKVAKILVSAVAVVLVVAIIFAVVGGDSSRDAAFMYTRDGELFLSDCSDSSGARLTEDYLSSDMAPNSKASEYLRVSSNGKLAFFFDKYDGYSYNLYYKYTNKLNSMPNKISSGILSYDISDDGKTVTYIKDAGDLFQHNLSSQSDKIDENVVSFLSSDDGKKIVYRKDNDTNGVYLYDIYYYEAGNKPEKIVTGANGIAYISDDLKSIYYYQNDALYRSNQNGKAKKLCDGVKEVVKVYETGELYYLKESSEDGSALYYFDGKSKSSLVYDGYYRAEASADAAPILVVYNNLVVAEDEYSYNVVVKDKCYPIQYDANSVDLCPSGKTIHFAANYNSHSGTAALYEAKVTDNGIKDIKKLSEEFYFGKYVSEDKYVYLEDYNVKEGVGTVYLNSKKVGEKISWYNVFYSEKDKALAYFMNYEKDGTAELNIFANGKSVKVAEKVYAASLKLFDDKFIYIADYKNSDGILYCYASGKATKIDHDVTELIPIIDNEVYDIQSRQNF